MPYPGGLLEQPTGVIERFEKILEALTDIEKAELERMRQEPPQ